MVKNIKAQLEESRTSNFFYLLIGLLALLSILFLMGGDDGLPFHLGRIISFMIVILFAYSLIDWTSHITEKSDDWKEKDDLDEGINMRIQDISELLDRASEGKKKSQEILHERLKKIFFLKLKETKDISDNELRDLVRKPEKFRKVVQDDVIADFILSMEDKSNKTKKEYSKFFSSTPKKHNQKNYKKEIKNMIQRIDEWEEKYHG